jgi:hypothetical protein
MLAVSTKTKGVHFARLSIEDCQNTRYPHSRFWAVYEDGQLLCVTVYKKGALAVMRGLQQMRRSA